MFFEDSKGDTVGEGGNTSVLCAEKLDQSCDVLKHPSINSEIALCNTPRLEAYKALDVLVAMGSETDPKSQGTLNPQINLGLGQVAVPPQKPSERETRGFRDGL